MKETTGNALALKAGMWYVICNFLLKGIAFITTPIFTRMMETSDYGITSTYSSYMMMISIIVSLDLYSCIQISKQDFEEDNHKFVSSVVSLSSISIGLFYVIMKIVFAFTGDFTGLPNGLMDILFLEVFFSNIFTIMQTYHRAYYKYKEFVFLTILSTVISIVLGMIIVYNLTTDKFWGKIIGNTIPMVIVGVIAIAEICKNGWCFYKKTYWQYALKISLPLIPHHLAGIVLSNFDRIMINSMCGNIQAGIYALAYNCALVIQVVWSSFNGAWTPWFFDAMKEDKIDEIKKATKPYIAVFCVLVLGSIVAGPELIMILGPEEYWEGIWIIPPVILGVFFQFIYSIYVNVEFYYKQTSKIAAGTVLAAIINVITNYIFINMFGYVAAAYTTLAGYIFLFLFHYKISRKIDGRDIFGKKFIFIVVGVMCAITALTMYLYKLNFIIRYGLLISILIIIGILYKEYIVGIIKKVIKR